MDNLTEIAERLLAWLLLPATVYGAAGAFVQTRRAGQSLRKTAVEVASGVLVTNAVAPLVEGHLAVSWHSTVYFLVGFGGMALAARVYDAAADALERRVRGKIDGNE